MPSIAVMSFLWIVAVAAFVGLMVYRGHLTQHETDELFLSDSDDHSYRKQEHDQIVRRVNRLQPYCKGAGGVAVLITICIVGMEVFNLANSLK